MKTALGFALAIVTGIAFWYGYDASLTVTPFVDGYIGAMIPAVLVLMGAGIGIAIND